MEKILGIVRHVIGGIGAGLIGFGLANADTVASALTHVDAIVGAVIFLGGVVASVVAKIKEGGIFGSKK